MVLALKTNRIGQSFLPCPFRALLFDFSPRFVLRAPGDLAGVLGQFLWRAEVVAVVPGQRLKRSRLGLMGLQRVLVDVVDAFVGPLGQQADRLLVQRLSHGHEAAGFKNVVYGAPDGAGWKAFLRSSVEKHAPPTSGEHVFLDVKLVISHNLLRRRTL